MQKADISLKKSFDSTIESPRDGAKMKSSTLDHEIAPASPSSFLKTGKKFNEEEIITVDLAGEETAAEKPKFPIRIPIEKMKPKKNYLSQVKHLTSNRSGRESKESKETQPTFAKKVPNRPQTAGANNIKKNQTRISKYGSGSKLIDKRGSTFQSEKENIEPNKTHSIGRSVDLGVKPWDVAKLIEEIVESKITEIKGDRKYRREMALEVKRELARKTLGGSMRPKSQNESDKKRALSSYGLNRSKDGITGGSSSMFYDPALDLEKNKEEIIKKAKKIIKENLHKYQEMIKKKREEEKQKEQEKLQKTQQLEEMNEKIREKNKKFKSNSPAKHKYAWGVDQKRLEYHPERSRSHEKVEKKEKIDDEKRREIIGLSYLNKIEEAKLAKLKNDYKKSLEAVQKELEEKYKPKKKEKSEAEKEQAKQLVKKQFEEREKKRLEEKAKKEEEKRARNARINEFMKKVKEIQAKEAEEKKNQPPKPESTKKKKKKRTKSIKSDGPFEDPTSNREFNTEPNNRDDEPDFNVSQTDRYKNIEKASDIITFIMLKSSLRLGFQAIKEASNKKKQEKKSSLANKQPAQTRQSETKGRKVTVVEPQEENIEEEIKEEHPEEQDVRGLMSSGKKKEIMGIIQKQKTQLYNQLENSQKKINQAAANGANGIIKGKSRLEERQERHTGSAQNKQLSRPATATNNTKKQLNFDFEIDEVPVQDKKRNTSVDSNPKKILKKASFTEEKKNNAPERHERDPVNALTPDFDELLFQLSSEELLKLPYFTVLNK